MPANRERLNTGGSYTRNRERLNTGGSFGSPTGELRERTHTVESIGSGGGSTDFQSVVLMGDSQSPKGVPRLLKSLSPTNQHRATSIGSHSGSAATSSGTTRRRRIVDWLQKQRVPRRLVTHQRRSSSQDGGDTVQLISGLDRVFFGTVAAADAVLIASVKPPRYLWYMLSGFLCDLIQFGMDVMLHMALKINDASLCWALGFLLSIVFRHTSHRYLVFGDYVGGYWASLTRMYAGYSVIVVISTVFNVFMTKVAETSHYVAWLLTLLWTGIANYFILKKLWSFGGTPTSASGGKVASSLSPQTTGSSLRK